jgi:diadenosine tetraphosphate (Ap4A) HIT family hydrolase
MEDYSKNIVKKYNHWTVYVHTNQSYLGRCIIWCDRENATDLSEATEDERNELFEIMREMKIALEKTFQADWINYSFLGNETPHLHGHLVPRYKNEKTFDGTIFKDLRWGHNWLTDRSFVTSKELLQSIKNEIIKNLQ